MKSKLRLFHRHFFACVFSNTIQNLRTKNSQVCGLALDYSSKMKIAVTVRQLDLGHILWCGRVVRVERAHRVRVVRSVQKMPDVGNGAVAIGVGIAGPIIQPIQ